MRILCVLGKYNYGTAVRGEGYEYVNFLPALRCLGHEVSLFDNWDRVPYSSFVELNHDLLATVERIRPELILSVQTHFEIWLETWQIIRDAGFAATINWATDDSWKYAQFSRFLAPAFHAFATTYPEVYEQYLRDGHKNIFLTQWAANSEHLKPPLSARKCPYPISFIGTAHGQRRARIETLHTKGFHVACFGHGWPQGPLPASEIPKIIQGSVISLNFSGGARVWKSWRFYVDDQVKARIFEVPGAGGFLLTEQARGLERSYQPGCEVAVFNNDKELADKLRYYLAHPSERDQIAQAGYERTRTKHFYELRFADLIEFAVSSRDRQFSQTGLHPTGKIDWDAFFRAARFHKLSPQLRAVKRLLSALGTAIWGPVRGPRAARRLVFELSWRLRGAQTYSSAGLPGRMFYLES